MIRQLAIIFACLVVGELVVALTGVKFPSSIIGMLLLTSLLKLGWVKLHWVSDIANIFSKNLAFFFVPPGVGLMLYFDLLREEFTAFAVGAVLSTVLVLLATGWVFQWLRKKR